MHSSSYIIGCKGKLTMEAIESVIGVELLSPYSEVSDEVVNYIIKYARLHTIREYMDVTHIEEHQLPDEIRYIAINAMDLYYGEINTKDDLKPGAMAFIAMGLNYRSDKFLFKKASYE